MVFPERALGPHLSLIREISEEPEPKEGSMPKSHKTEEEKPSQISLHQEQRRREEQRRQEEHCLLAELARIEQELRDRLRREKLRLQAQDMVRQEENRLRWRSLCYMGLSQRINKPWVFSFYKNFPMHLYCQPIRSTSHGHDKKKRKTRR